MGGSSLGPFPGPSGVLLPPDPFRQARYRPNPRDRDGCHQGHGPVNAADFVEARRRLEAKPRSAGEKLTTLDAAASRVRDGDHVAIGGCLFSRTPMALVREILRRGPRHLTCSRNLMCYEGELLMVAGTVDKIVTSWMSIGLPWGVSKILREYVESGRVPMEEWSHLALGLRYRAAAMGVPFLPTLTMLGSDLMSVGQARSMPCPFTGETLCLVPALFPDVAMLHVHRADRFGNCQIDGYPHMDADIARASTTVLVTAEEIISDAETRRHPDRTVIPGFVVDALAEVPFGSYPHECYGLYEADFEHFGDYTAAIEATGSDAVRAYLDRFVFAPASYAEYLALFGEDRLTRQRLQARELTG
ncbi:MAG: CoA transferase subunit A [Candidatus Rokubacteria bacterium]|nr:CoA transferase subunit A [Candidatus Rokubacteria bacterium]